MAAISAAFSPAPTPGALDHHAGEARLQRQAGHGASELRHLAVRIERAERGEQRLRLLHRRLGRRVEEGEGGGIAHAPHGEVEHEAREVGGEDFRRRIGRQARGLRLVPEAQAHARLGAARASAPLVGGGARDAHGLQPGQPDAGLEARHAGEAADRPRCARPRWSGWSRRWRWRAPPCAGPAGRGRWRGPARADRARHRAGRCRRPDRGPPRARPARCGGSRRRRAGRRAPSRSRSSARAARRPSSAGRWARADRGRDSGSRRGRRALSSRSPAPRRAALPRGRRRAWRTSPGCAGPRAARLAHPRRGRGRDRRRGCAHGTRRTARRRRPTVRGRRASCG